MLRLRTANASARLLPSTGRRAGMMAPALPGPLAAIAPYLNRCGYAAVGGLLLLEDFGVPVPGEAVMIAASVYAGAGRLNVAAVAAVAFMAAVAGDSIGWVIGRHGGHRLLARFGRYVLLPPHRVARAEAFFARHGGKIVPVARFVDVLRQADGIIAGLTGMRFPRFLALNAIGATLWVGTWTTAGYLAGHHITTLYPAITRLERYELAVLGLVGAALLARAVVRRRRTGAGPTDRRPANDGHRTAEREIMQHFITTYGFSPG
jgi:membrane protein DedA with SNARE-associated domain